ncbi:MAG TPA: DUF1232 domain-containing protein [Cytophagaceae bacterium]
MEKGQKNKSTENNKLTIKDKLSRWISKSPRFEHFLHSAKYYFQHPEKLNESINEIYNKATHQEQNLTLADTWIKLQATARMVGASFRGEYNGLPKGKLYLGLVVLLYFITPFDFFPDFLPFLGFADDAALLIWFVGNLAKEVEKYQAWENAQAQVATPA